MLVSTAAFLEKYEMKVVVDGATYLVGVKDVQGGTVTVNFCLPNGSIDSAAVFGGYDVHIEIFTNTKLERFAYTRCRGSSLCPVPIQPFQVKFYNQS